MGVLGLYLVGLALRPTLGCCGECGLNSAEVVWFWLDFGGIVVSWAQHSSRPSMRKTLDSQLKLGQIPIAEMKINPKDRDDIPAVLAGLRALYVDENVRAKIFEILEERVRPEVDHNRGRPGMDLWRIFVLGVVKQALNIDFDRLRNLADEHRSLRQMLGHSDYVEDMEYRLQTIIDNVSLLSEDMLREINAVVVRCGHERLNHARQDSLEGRVDSAVTQTHVHWPTDVNLLRDAMERLLRLLPRACVKHEIKGWRKSRFWTNQVKAAFQQVRTFRRWRNVAKVEAYLALCRKLVARMQLTLTQLQTLRASTYTIEMYLDHAVRQIDQVERRLIKNEVIPHEEKVFSIHEPHTRWINKGKAGVKAELGLPVCYLEDQHQFILHHEVLLEGVDSDMIVPFVEEAQRRYPTLDSMSTDRGYWSPGNRTKLDKMLRVNALPKKGGKSKADQARESAPEFAEARQQHPAIESAIHNLNHRGLARVRTHGVEGFVRTVALGVVAANVHRLGQIVKAQQKRYEAWHQARRKAA